SLVPTESTFYAEWDALGPETIPALEKVLREQQNPSRYLVVEKLAHFSTPEVINALLAAADDPDELVRVQVYRAFRIRHSPAIARCLLRGFEDAAPKVRIASIQAVPTLADATLLDKVVPFLTDPIWDIQIESAKALGRSGNPKYRAVLESLTNQQLPRSV